nr:MAG TPA: hypothetical protein [Bacteriophage sp.]
MKKYRFLFLANFSRFIKNALKTRDFSRFQKFFNFFQCFRIHLY